jgi:hypothetical protein
VQPVGLFDCLVGACGQARRDLQADGLSENEIGRARISMMARNANVPFKGRIQKRKTYHLQIITFGLQRAAGPYSRARRRHHARLEAHFARRTNQFVGTSDSGMLMPTSR